MSRRTLDKIDEFDAKGEIVPWSVANRQTTLAVMFANPVAWWVFGIRRKYLRHAAVGDVRTANECVRRVVRRTTIAIFIFWGWVIGIIGVIICLVCIFGK